MLHVQCKQCGAWTTTLNGDDPDSALKCDCCPEDHDHAASANDCPGAGLNHVEAPCPHPDDGKDCNVVTPLGDECPGEHCGVEIPGCTVCRPVVITLMAGVS